MGIIFQILVVYFLLLVSCSANKNVPAFFTFGDSLVDVGNNNYLQTTAKGNYFPFGIDFGNNPTGRFSNGRTTFDILQQELGFTHFTPPYLAPTTVGEALLQGVNYASAGSGIFNSTGYLFGDRINFDTQMSYHGRTVLAIMSRIIPAAQKLLRRAIYGVAIGSNDIMFKESAPVAMSEEAFLDFLISRLKSALTTLYNLNARKIIVTNAGACGCIPFEKDIHPVPKGSCVRLINRLAHTYNDKLKGMLAELNKDLQGAKFIYVDIYRIILDLTNNYVSYGFENATSACCWSAVGRGGLLPCNPLSKVCPDRSKYIFWDVFHLTDAANVIAARHMMDGGLNYTSPMNFRQLVQS
ncbi:PREDICTED: GDSL esterase/lipase At4g16230-like [Prunus mume]|uniref:GDSL esterase/lipase At4g16230-like n=1 Tax=Prunus mume TaxID=102107 RepID=A0ABM0NE14_PRUMU|nr:PREDICTED: GDSL esterase/lipase At4g16230-like [Prunus mume]